MLLLLYDDNDDVGCGGVKKNGVVVATVIVRLGGVTVQ